MLPAQHHFNNSIDKIQVASKHTNRLLKMCFGLLDELRLSISNSDKAMFACDWISACIVLNNMVIAKGSPICGMHKERHALNRLLPPSETEERRAEFESFGFEIQCPIFAKFCEDKGY